MSDKMSKGEREVPRSAMREDKQVYLLGVSFRTAPLSVRESLSFNAEGARELLCKAALADPEREALVLSTCNRTEFYLAAPSEAGAPAEWLKLLAALRPDASIRDRACHRYELSGAQAVRHLFSVAAGLESAILGDVQILGQVKQAFDLSTGHNLTGSHLYETLRRALRVGKRVRRETALGSGAASLGSVVAEMLERRAADATGHKVLIVGAGEIARDSGRHLAKRGFRDLSFINRTDGKAAILARQTGGRAVRWEQLHEEVGRADVIITATSAPRPILTRSLLESMAVGRRPLIIDAGVPRNVEPGAEARVFDIDAIREMQGEALAAREAARPKAEAIVDHEVQLWNQWRARRPVEEIIKQLYEEAAQQCQEEAGQLAEQGAIEAEQARRMIQRCVKRALHGHVGRLRELATTVRFGRN